MTNPATDTPRTLPSLPSLPSFADIIPTPPAGPAVASSSLTLAYAALASAASDLAYAREHNIGPGSVGVALEAATTAFTAAHALLDRIDDSVRQAWSNPEAPELGDPTAFMDAVAALREVGLTALRVGVEGFPDDE